MGEVCKDRNPVNSGLTELKPTARFSGSFDGRSDVARLFSAIRPVAPPACHGQGIVPLLRHPLLPQNLPHPIRPDRNLHVRHAQVGQRVHHRVGDRGRRPYRSRLTHALRPQRMMR